MVGRVGPAATGVAARAARHERGSQGRVRAVLGHARRHPGGPVAGDPQSASPEKLALPALREKAKQAGADLAVFDYEMALDFGGPMEDREVEEARALGLRPVQIVIDGEVLSAAAPAWVIRNAIDRALGRPR